MNAFNVYMDRPSCCSSVLGVGAERACGPADNDVTKYPMRGDTKC